MELTYASSQGRPNPVANISNSQITGQGAGISVVGETFRRRAVLNLDRTQVIGQLVSTADPALAGNGIVAFEGSDIHVGNGSVVTGAQNGIYAVGSSTSPIASRVVIDASRVEGNAGAALIVPAPTLARIPDSDVRFTVRNGAQLIGSNGNLLEVTAAAATVGFTVDDSNLAGNIINTAGSIVDVGLTNNASLRGATENITSMAVDNARWQLTGSSSTGSVSLGSGGEIALGDGSAFHSLNVAGNFSGAGGTIIFNTVLAGDS
ncbi:autotransporter outer membrane beta-barrel domain-containing protein, partial [Stenotrophomonas maltophilia]